MNTDRKTVHVTPAPGRVVPDPEYGDDLPAAGRTVARSPYWVRRVKDGDVTVTVTEAEVAADVPVELAKASKGGK